MHSVTRRSPHVPGQYRGLSLQADRFLVHLLSSGPGTIVSLEVVGDTGIDMPDGTRQTEKAKSRTSRANPLGNTSPEFSDALRRTRKDQIILDLVRVKTPREEIQGNYRGICW